VKHQNEVRAISLVEHRDGIYGDPQYLVMVTAIYGWISTDLQRRQKTAS
jgi:hypothetical protein